MMIWRKHAILTPPTDEEMVAMAPDELIELHSIYHEAIENAEKDPYHYGFRLPHWGKAEEQLFEVNEILALGGNRCLAPDQEIYDPVSKQSIPVSKIKRDFHVLAWDGEKQIQCRALRPFVKTVAKTYQVILGNGDSFQCSAEHQVSTPFGWRCVKDIGIGGVVSIHQTDSSSPCSSGLQGFSSFLPHSKTASIPSRFRLNALRWIQRLQDSLSDCQSSPRFYGGQLPFLKEICPNDPPSQADAPEYSGYVSLLAGGQDSKLLHNRPYSQSVHLSNPYEVIHYEGHSEASESCVSYRVLKPQQLTIFDRIFQKLGRKLLSGFCLVRSVPLVPRLIQRVLGFFSSALTMPWETVIVKVYDKPVSEIWDIDVPETGNYFIGDVLQKNSGKTQWGAFSVVRAAIENPKSEIFCFAQTSEVSIRQQQSAVWDWLPENLKTKQTSANTYISYKKKTGFTDSSLILPNGSQIIFKTYSQYQNNPTILEGAELGSKNAVWHNIGVWLDEYLLGPELINTLRFRLATRNAKMLVTFTPIDGWTEVIKEYLDGATTIESRAAELLNGELVPYVQKSKKLNASVHYFHSQDNAFGGYERIKETLSGRTREEILIRAYGVPMKSHATKFPKFNKVVNVVPPDKIPTKNITRYHVIDPAGAKNWFMCWIAVDETGTFWVYREWPGVDVGDWAEWKSGKWMPGPGSKGQGFGIRDYIEAIQDMEGEEEIFERLIDPRLGAAKYQVQDGSSSIIEDLNESGMVCVPAPGLDIDDGLQALIGKMSWDSSKPLDSVNRPRFYVSSDCENIIQALSEYTGEGGLKEAWKDPIDVCRYAAIANLDHVDNSQSFVTTHGSGGY
jgi:hypothetical protein